MKHIDIKRKIINKLDGEFEVVSVDRNFGKGTSVICRFVKNGKEGVFRYFWSEEEHGIDYVRDYEEEDDEDIYMDIHDWIDKHFKYEIKIDLKYDGKELI